MSDILIATGNRGKLDEFGRSLADLSLNLLSLAEFPYVPEAVETGSTFAENARAKASFYSSATGLWSMADDSGLEVSSLNGAPGVYSARFAGEAASDAENYHKLLRVLKARPEGERVARFVCEIAVSDPSGGIRAAACGECPGRIAEEPLGSNGFGYDPVFIPDGYSKTFGELNREVKLVIGHRAKAIAKIKESLQDFLVS